jgi:threonine aldolase
MAPHPDRRPATVIHVDLRSDTVTRPTPRMREVIAAAEVGDAVLGDDPTADRLERTAAELLGKERALFFPSGIMANTTALLVLSQPGAEVVIDAGGHIFNYEEGAAAAFGGLQLRPVATPDGFLTPELLEGAIRPRSPYFPRSAVLCLENTHNNAGGRVLPPGRMEELAALAHERGLCVHLDGARLPNAAVASGRSLAELAAPADTVMISMSKGLGAPVGSILAGREREMEAAWRVRRRLGGGMRQVGLLAAAALYALDNHFDRLADDHRRARALATGLSKIEGLASAPPETNIVMVDLVDPALPRDSLLRRLEEDGVRMVAFGPRRLRAVTHLDVDDDGVEHAVDTMRRAVASVPR